MPKWTQQQKEAAREAKRLGLISQDLRRAPTRYLLSRLRDPQIAAAIRGEASVIKTPSATAARTYSGTFKVYKSRIIVPKSITSGKIAYDKKQKALTADGKPLPRLKSDKKSGYEIHILGKDGTSTVVFQSHDLNEVDIFIGLYAAKWKGQYAVTRNGIMIEA